MRRLTLLIASVVLDGLPSASAQIVEVQAPRTLTYRGILAEADGSPSSGTFQFSFVLYDADGIPIVDVDGSPWDEQQEVTLSNGSFTAVLGRVRPLNLPFDKPYFLEVSVDGSPLSPRAELTAVAYSLHALSVADGSVTDAKIPDGQVVRSINNIHRDDVTIRGGENVTIDEDEEGLIINATGGVSGGALRIEDNAESPNIIAGYSGNFVYEGAVGATIGGGGKAVDSGFGEPSEGGFQILGENQVSDNYGTVGGGQTNVAGNGTGQVDDASWATVSGGRSNRAAGEYATVAGGQNNAVVFNTSWATVSGGLFNQAAGEYATVAGGQNNEAAGSHAAVLGGSSNRAGGDYSFAAGRSASVVDGHHGSFVWADSDGNSQSGDSFESTGPDQFLIRASGGVGIGTNEPDEGTQLHVAGNARVDGQIRADGLELPLGAVPGHVLTAGANGVATWQEAAGGGSGVIETSGEGGTASITIFDAIRIERNEDNEDFSPPIRAPNVIFVNRVADIEINQVWNGVAGATISGGGARDPSSSDVELSRGNFVYDHFGTIGGGANNRVGNNNGSTISGGGRYGTAGGGQSNRVEGGWSTVGGGESNVAGLQGDSYNTVGGGRSNRARGEGSTIAGGSFNHATSGSHATVGGGHSNRAENTSSTIAGGNNNKAGGLGATIGGGSRNSTDGRSSTVSGGESSTANGEYATVGGGSYNTVSAAFGTIAGGGPRDPSDVETANRVTDNHGTVGGGGNNQAGDADSETTNATYATVGGGEDNAATGAYATIPGGRENRAEEKYSFAAGWKAHADHPGSFVWADATGQVWESSRDNQFLVRAKGGVGIGTQNPDAPIHVMTDLPSNEADTEPGSGGYLVLGDIGGKNLSMDDNEIMARDNRGTSVLHLQADGGEVRVGGTTVHTSDRRLKKNIRRLQDALTQLESMRGVRFDWKDNRRSSHAQIGVIAQEVEEAFPELVSEGEDGIKSVAYANLTAVLIEAVKELHGIVKEKDAQLQAQQAETRTLHNHINELSERMAAFEAIMGTHSASHRSLPVDTE